MKSIICILLLFTLSSCHKSYTLKITKTDPYLGGVPIFKLASYPFKAPDDQTAFYRSAEHFYKDCAVDSLMNYATGKTQSFQVFDADGNDLKSKLPLKNTDSIEKSVKMFTHNVAKNLKNPLVH